jgi:hypothetical protein
MADEEIVLSIVAKDKYSAEMKEATAAVDKMTDAEKKSALAAKEHADQMEKLGNIVKGAAIGGFVALTAAVGDSLKETMDYNKQVRDLAQNIGMTTEETSRLIQTADDFTVSQEAVTNAMQMMVKRGIAPSIEGLAKIADQYVAIKDPVKQAALMTELLGRNWTALTPMLKEGGTAIRDAAASQSDALIVTEAQSKATRDLEKNMDSLGDALLGVKLTFGNAIIPTVKEATGLLTKFTSIVSGTEAPLDRMAREREYLISLYGRESKEVVTATRELESYAVILELSASKTDASDRATRRNTDAIQSQSKAQSDAEASMAAFSSTVQIASKNSTDYKLATDALIISTQNLTKETYAKIAVEGLSPDSALRVMTAMGMIDQKTASRIEKERALKDEFLKTGNIDVYIKKLRELGQAIDLLPSYKALDIEVNIQTGGHGGKVGGAIGDDIVNGMRNKGQTP